MLELLGVLSQGQPGGTAAADGLVVGIGEIHHPLHLKASQLQMLLQEILERAEDGGLEPYLHPVQKNWNGILVGSMRPSEALAVGR